MKRRLLNLLTALSLLLCVAAVALWVRSYAVSDMCDKTVASGDDDVLTVRTYHLISNGGTADFVRTTMIVAGVSRVSEVRKMGIPVGGWNHNSRSRGSTNDRNWWDRHRPYWRTAASVQPGATYRTAV